MVCMKHSVVALRFILLFLLSVCCFAQTPASQPGPKSGQHTPIMPLSEVRAGMHGTAYTVFEGVKPEPMDLEILGVLKNWQTRRRALLPHRSFFQGTYRRSHSHRADA